MLCYDGGEGGEEGKKNETIVQEQLRVQWITFMYFLLQKITVPRMH